MNAKAVKTIRKVERPRPLRCNSDSSYPSNNDLISNILSKRSLSEILPELEKLYVSVNGCSFDEKTADDINKLCNLLKTYGQEMENTMNNMLNHYFVTIRNISREDRLDAISRLKLLEIIEMKAMGWQVNENIVSYYKRKIAELEGAEKTQAQFALSTSSSSSQVFSEQSIPIGVPLAPGEIIRSSGKFINPTKIAGKNYFKDEVVIRNSDSGKVNPGVRDRRVQIAGPNEESISLPLNIDCMLNSSLVNIKNFAKTLVEDTIRRNASPVRELVDNNSNIETNCLPNYNAEEQNIFPNTLMHSFSMGDASIGEFTEHVTILGDIIKLSGKNVDILKMAKKLLQGYFPAQEQPTLPLRTNFSENVKNEFNKSPRLNLQRSSSWLGSVSSRTSISPLDSSSEEEIKDSEVSYGGVDSEDSVFPYKIIPNEVPSIPPPHKVEPLRKVYTQKFLLSCRDSPFAKRIPHFKDEVYSIYGDMIRDNSRPHSINANSPLNSQESSDSLL